MSGATPMDNIQCNILDDGKGLEIKFSGIIYGDNIINALKNYYVSKPMTSVRYKIIDFLNIKELFISPDEVLTLAKLDKQALTITPELITTLLIPGKSLGIIGKLWVDAVDDDKGRFRNFYSRDSALKWIKEKIN